MALGLELAARLAEVVPGLRFAQPDRGEEVLAPEDGNRDEEVGHGVPVAGHLRGAFRRVQPSAVLFAEALGDV